ncbi:MAG: hypothetical protein ACRD0Z_06490 [Acidimicrobiales bacterium]
MKLRNVAVIAAVGLSTGFVLGVPGAFASSLSSTKNVVHCISKDSVCGEQSNPPLIVNGQAFAWAATYMSDDANSVVRVIENYETHHWYGWTTDNSWDSGNHVAISVVQEGVFNCSGGTYEFYARNYLKTHQVLTTGGTVFSCKN